MFIHFKISGALSMDLYSKMIVLCVHSAVDLSYVVHQAYKDAVKLRHQTTSKNPDEKREALNWDLSSYQRSTSAFVQMLGTQNKANECSYTVAHCITDEGRPFTDGKFIKKAFLRSAKILFSDLPNPETVHWG
uniref:Uncharacterized protein n=1 Tax=Octopus bimaculoides TaxID=37653 RepID=A0A0L8GL94_OCTBM